MRNCFSRLLIVLFIVGYTPMAVAQYMYLDTNGDGAHSDADVLAANGSPTTVDVWLHTNANRDGSPAVCNMDPSTPLAINSYVVNFEAFGGSVTFSDFINRQPQWTVHFTEELNSDGVHYKNGFGGFPPHLDPGLYRLATLTITGQTGTPAIRIVDLIPGSLDYTSFGSACIGNDFDNTYKLTGPAGGTDWTDADGTEGGPDPTNRPPVLAPIGNKAGLVGVPLTFTATATDPDLPPQTLTFSLGPFTDIPATIDPSSGVFSWIPSAPGQFEATILVTDNGTPPMADFETIQLMITTTPQAPVLNPIADRTTNEGAFLIFVATVSDPTQNGLTWTLGPGAPAGAFIGSANGLFQWLIAEGQGPGVYPITVNLSSNADGLIDSETFVVTVNEVNALPQFTGGLADMTVTEGETATQQLTAFDADIPAQTLFFSMRFGGPPFALVSATGLITVSPGFTDSGTYTLRVRVSDGNLFSDNSLDITVLDTPPVADAGGPYEGLVGVPVQFDGTGSSDPDGSPLTFAWNFGDGLQGLGATPAHTYQGSAVYNVTLTVTTGGETASDATTATILPDLDMTVFTTGGNKTINLSSGKPETCVQMEPVGGAFDIQDVDPGSIRMTYGGMSIPAISGKTAVGSDKNQNGVDEMRACFSKENLRTLFAGLPGGEQSVSVLLYGTHLSGAPIQGNVTLRVKSGGGQSLAIAPNPLNPSATVTFSTSRHGAVRVHLYDLHGRLVRTLLDVSSAAPGYRDVLIDGMDAAGKRLASGVYYVGVNTVEGSTTKAITILK